MPSLRMMSDSTLFYPQAMGSLTGTGEGWHIPTTNLNPHYGDSRPALGPNGGPASMQWLALYSSNPDSGSGKPVGLYFATQDSEGMLQLMGYNGGRYPNATDPGMPAGIRWLHLPEDLADSSPSARYELSYQVIIESFSGDWFDASQIYREWVLPSASWTQAGNLSSRAGHHVAQVRKTPSWPRSWANFSLL